MLLAALAALGVVEPTPAGRYRPAPGADLLDPMLQLFDGLPDTVRSGQPVQPWEARAVASEMYPNLVGMLAGLLATAVEHAAELLARSRLRVLDLAAGAAPWSLALARRHPSIRVTAMDLPMVLPRTRRGAKEQGLEQQYCLVAGDAFTDHLGGPYDLALVANLCHLFGTDANLRLLHRLRPCLASEGRVAIIDVVANDRPNAAIALYDLSLLVRTTNGAVHPFSTYVDWLTRSGYQHIEQHKLDASAGVTLVLATPS